MYEIYAKEIGEALVDTNLLSSDDMEEILALVRSGQSLDELVLRRGVEEKDFYRSLAKVLGLPFVDLSDYRTDPQILGILPTALVRESLVFPLFKVRTSLVLAMLDPTDMAVLDRVREASGCEIDPVVAARSEILSMIDQHYGAGRSMGTLVQTLYREEEKTPAVAAEAPPRGVEAEEPVIQLVDLLIQHAVKERASDIHIEPDLKTLRVRIRIDGVLHEVPAPPKKFEAAVISRVKVLCDMNIAENRVPQDGRFSFSLDTQKIDVRVSSIPTVFGENIVLRLLDTRTLQFDLPDLGFSASALERFNRLITRPYGMVLVTGPTGSGKTTTLYTALRRINSPGKNIVTIEDPVEYRLEMIRQIQVSPKVGLTFATGLRSIVRQDPDIIMVGEIRDLETAEIAVQSALTGHLVFSTLHTNDAAGASIRLADMGVESFLVASSVLGVVAQRLVRVICQKCKCPDEIPESVLERFHLEGGKLMKGAGCRHCHQTGFWGRIGVFEVMVFDEETRALILSNAPASAMRKKAAEGGVQFMLEDGLEKARQGMTTLDEVLRVAQNVEQ